MENRTGRVLEVLDADGVPFLRLGPEGTEANLAAAEWYRTAAAGDPAPTPVRATAIEPRWTRIADDPSWGWFDRRIRSDGVAVPHGLRHAGMRARVGTWTIGMRVDGRPVELSGRFDFVPPRQGAFQPRLTSPSEVLPGVRVSLVSGPMPALYLENHGAEAVTVLGTGDEPFLRIGPDGTWRHGGTAAEWQLASSSPRYAWIEPRAAYPDDVPPEPSRERSVVRRWRVPLRRGTERTVVQGVVEWIPTTVAEPPIR
jgi:hypothetical protein